MVPLTRIVPIGFFLTGVLRYCHIDMQIKDTVIVTQRNRFNIKTLNDIRAVIDESAYP